MRIGIVGGGLLGAGAALELALRGHRVELFEREADCLTGASRQNEGKIHLGFVYGQDRSLATARLMARGAFSFVPLLRRWLGARTLGLDLSTPYYYLVHRDSQRSADDLEGYYARVVEIAREEGGRQGAAYACGGVDASCRRLSASERGRIAGDAVADAFLTSELAVNPEPLAALLRSRLLAEPRIVVHQRAEVTRVAVSADAVTVDVADPDGMRTATFDHVVNASWDDLLRIDGTAGVEPRAPWSFRLKRYLRVAAAERPPLLSATIVLGGFGDVVGYGGGVVFLSWYPAGCTGLSTAIRHPQASERLAPCDAVRLRADIHGPLAALVPAVAGLPGGDIARASVEGGVILALGTTDVDDPRSGLHERSAVGPRSFGRYHTVDTGKWTTAPLFAHEVARRIVGEA